MEERVDVLIRVRIFGSCTAVCHTDLLTLTVQPYSIRCHAHSSTL